MKHKALLASFLFGLLLAGLVLAPPGKALAVSPEEQARIDILLQALKLETDLVFIRNGSEHTAGEAVSHLELKLRRAGRRVSTAEEFIDHLASASSLSKRPYLIRRPGREAEPAGPFLHRLLRELAPAPSGRAAPAR
jgi:hypothetical protein